MGADVSWVRAAAAATALVCTGVILAAAIAVACAVGLVATAAALPRKCARAQRPHACGAAARNGNRIGGGRGQAAASRSGPLLTSGPLLVYICRVPQSLAPRNRGGLPGPTEGRGDHRGALAVVSARLILAWGLIGRK